MIPSKPQKERLVHLDYLRGYFVIVIIIDHLSRFPSAWQFISGRGILWATAAEGFVMISGLMIGYIRVLKGVGAPYLEIAYKLLKRALLLYFWMVISSLAYVAATWRLAEYRSMPWYNADKGDWPTVFHQVVTMEIPQLWVHFLYLYTIFLALSIPAVWLLRRRQPWLLACFSIVAYIYGLTTNTEWLKFQILFFIPAIVGFYIPSISAWWQTYSHKKALSTIILLSATISVVLSTLYIFTPYNMPNASYVNGLFNGTVFGVPRLIISALWFTALVILFQQITPWLQKYTKSVVGYLGTHSLTAYVAHGVVILGISLFLLPANNFFLNTLLGLIAILGVYAFIRIPLIKKLLPR